MNYSNLRRKPLKSPKNGLKMEIITIVGINGVLKYMIILDEG